MARGLVRHPLPVAEPRELCEGGREILARATKQQVRRALDSFGDAEVHVVLSARDLVRQLPAEWQENVKHRRTVGFRDFLGTGVYSGEYLVATKTVQDFKFSAGLGWGRLAGIGATENPFCSISDSMCDRDDDFGEGGGTETQLYQFAQHVDSDQSIEIKRMTQLAAKL